MMALGRLDEVEQKKDRPLDPESDTTNEVGELAKKWPKNWSPVRYVVMSAL
jgi:hypothetical protein